MDTAYSCILYDLDGTLIDSREDIAAALNEGRQHFGLEAHPLEKVMGMIGHGLPNLVKMGFADTDIPQATSQPVVEEIYQAHPARYSTCFPGVRDTLQALHEKGFKQMVISNKSSFLVPPVLKALQIDTFFTAAFGGEDFPQRKPDPIAVTEILKRFPDLTRQNLIMVGDMAPDLDMAKNAGIDSVFCSYGYSPVPLDATYQIQTFSDLQSLFKVCS